MSISTETSGSLLAEKQIDLNVVEAGYSIYGAHQLAGIKDIQAYVMRAKPKKKDILYEI